MLNLAFLATLMAGGSVHAGLLVCLNDGVNSVKASESEPRQQTIQQLPFDFFAAP